MAALVEELEAPQAVEAEVLDDLVRALKLVANGREATGVHAAGHVAVRLEGALDG